jgi:signal transduction histidine kinase
MGDEQKILVVDDRPENLLVLRQELRDLEAQVIEAPSGEEALALTLEHDFAVAILDVVMPGMNGFELAELLRGDDATRRIPIIFLTASLQEESDVFQGYLSGGVDVLTKPFSPEVLRAKVSVFLELDSYRRQLKDHRDHLEALVGERTFTLEERVREIECLNRVSSILADPGIGPEEGLQRIADVLASQLHEPGVASTRISQGGRDVESAGFSESEEFRRVEIADEESGADSFIEVHLHDQDGGGRRRDVHANHLRLLGEVARQLAVAESQRRLHAQLIQSQKMESIGRLAGGVAHDFNNMLSVIMGCAEMVQLRTPQDHPSYAKIQEIIGAAEKSARLTGQLLAFARRQTIAPRVLDLNQTVEEMLKMLRRLIGEDVELEWKPAPGLWPVKLDPGQVDQILANLAVNARDAMQGTGRLVLETENVTVGDELSTLVAEAVPGEHVLLNVSDSGCGMDSATLAQVFEPFFTTKPAGEGTGLGLATVYGIVRQNGGFVDVRSAPGQGTTFRIYLPRHVGEASVEERTTKRAVVRGYGETILLVEDEEGLLEMCSSMLAELGYNVLAAPDPAEALKKSLSHKGPIHLLVTDVVMPGMDGRQLADTVARDRPETPVLFMSGYTPTTIVKHGVFEGSDRFLQKPFSVVGLARTIRDILDEKAAVHPV